MCDAFDCRACALAQSTACPAAARPSTCVVSVRGVEAPYAPRTEPCAYVAMVRSTARGCGGARRALARNHVCASRYLLRLRAWLQTVRRTQTACLPVPDPRRRGRQRLQTGQSVPLYFSATNVAATIPTQAIEHYNFYIYHFSIITFLFCLNYHFRHSLI